MIICNNTTAEIQSQVVSQLHGLNEQYRIGS